MLKRIIALILTVFAMIFVFTACNSEGKQGIKGEQGIQGEKGEQGIQGIQGEKGTDGRGIIKTEIKEGCLWITYSDDLENPVNVGKIESESKNENPQVLDFYLLPDGTYGVMAGKALYLDKIIIPESYNGKAVTKILPSAFSGAYNLTEITLPHTITGIGNSAFFNCGNLEKIDIPEGVVTISNQAFAYCSKLEAVTVPDDVTTIGEKAFRDCSSLKSVVIGVNITSIGEYAFYNCSSINSIEFENTANWKAGTTVISATDINNFDKIKTYLTQDYSKYEWTRT